MRISNSHKLILSLLSGEPNISEVTDFVLHVAYNRPMKEKNPRKLHYNMLMKKKKQIKSRKKKYNTSMELHPDQSLLKMKLLQASFVAHHMSHCLNPNYVSLDRSFYGWKLVENHWQSIWFEGYTLSHSVDLLDIAEVSSEEVHKTSEKSILLEPEESEMKRITLATAQNILPLLQRLITLIMILIN